MKMPSSGIGNRKKRVQLATWHDNAKKAAGDNKSCDEARVRITRENMEDNSESVPAICLLMAYCFSMSSKGGRLCFHILFRSSQRLLKKCSSE